MNGNIPYDLIIVVVSGWVRLGLGLEDVSWLDKVMLSKQTPNSQSQWLKLQDVSMSHTICASGIGGRGGWLLNVTLSPGPRLMNNAFCNRGDKSFWRISPCQLSVPTQKGLLSAHKALDRMGNKILKEGREVWSPQHPGEKSQNFLSIRSFYYPWEHLIINH